MKYCSNCGTSQIVVKVPPGDNRERNVCLECDSIFYENPRIVAGTIPVWEDRILMCKRAIEPRYGFWTLPAGFMENAESAFDAAARETLEEANARVSNLRLYNLISLPMVDQVYMMFVADLDDLQFSAGDESLEVRLMGESEIPWDDLAFPTIYHTLRQFFQDRDAPTLPLRTGDILRVEGRARYVPR